MNSDVMPVNISKVRNDLRWKATVTGAGFVDFVFALCARLSLLCCDHAVVRNWIAHVYGSYHNIWMVGCTDIDYAVTPTVWRWPVGSPRLSEDPFPDTTMFRPKTFRQQAGVFSVNICDR